MSTIAPVEPKTQTKDEVNLGAITREIIASRVAEGHEGADVASLVVADLIVRARAKHVRSAMVAYAARSLYNEQARGTRWTAPAEDEAEQSGLVAQARERGRAAADAGAARYQSAALAWMQCSRLCTGVSLYEAKLADLTAQFEHHRKQVEGNARSAKLVDAFRKLYRKRCPDGDKKLGEVVPPTEAQRIVKKFEK